MASGNKTEQRLAALRSEDVKARKEAALWLGRKGIREALDPLLWALQDGSWKVRRNAAVALGNIGNLDAVEPLIARLSDPTLSVKRAAIHSLGTLRDARATVDLVRLTAHPRLGQDALQAVRQIGAPALLRCCYHMQNDNPDLPSLWRETARHMILARADLLLREVLSIEDWSGYQRWLILETVRTVQSCLPFFEVWRLTKFSRLSDIPGWCERIARDPEQAALYAGIKQVQDYIMLGRASLRDDTAERAELLRAADGTKGRDTGESLLRASIGGGAASEQPSLLDRLRRWLRQEE